VRKRKRYEKKENGGVGRKIKAGLTLKSKEAIGTKETLKGIR